MANETVTKKDVKAAAAPPATANGANGQTETPKRTRLSFSKEKRLAYLMAGLVTILTSKPVAAVLTEDQKAKVVKAKTQANEIGGGDPFKGVTDRILAIQSELKAIDYSKDPEKAVANALELGKELDRQIKRKKQIEEMIGG